MVVVMCSRTCNCGILIDRVVVERATHGCDSVHDPVRVALTRYCRMFMHGTVTTSATMVVPVSTTGSQSGLGRPDPLGWNSFGWVRVSTCDTLLYLCS